MLRMDGGAAVDADGEGGADDGPGDAVGEGGVGDTPAVGTVGDADGDGAAGDALSVGAACDADGEGAAIDALLDGAAGDTLTIRVLQGVLRLMVPRVKVLQVVILGVGPRMGGRRWFWVRALTTPDGGPGWCCWSVFSPVLAVLVTSGVEAGNEEGGAGNGVVAANREGVAGFVPGDADGEGAVGGDAAGSW